MTSCKHGKLKLTFSPAGVPLKVVDWHCHRICVSLQYSSNSVQKVRRRPRYHGSNCIARDLACSIYFAFMAHQNEIMMPTALIAARKSIGGLLYWLTVLTCALACTSHSTLELGRDGLLIVLYMVYIPPALLRLPLVVQRTSALIYQPYIDN